MAYFILMGRRIPKQAITGFKFQNETDNIRPFLSIRIRGKDEIIPFKDKIEGAFNRCSACVEIMANDDNGVSMMHYIDYEDIIGVELIKN